MRQVLRGPQFCPRRGGYVGPTHEAFIRAGGRAATPAGVRFSEPDKTPAQYRQKAERDIAILTRHTAAHSDDPRWFYYLGHSLAGLGRPAQTVYWARQSVAMGLYCGAGTAVPRIGFRHLPALWEGPYEVLRFALRAIGDDAGADQAERLFHEAKAAREG